MINKIKQILSEVLEIELNQINDEFNQNDCTKWDSIHHLNLVVDLETEFDIDLEPEEIAIMTSLSEIISIVKQKTS